MEDEEAESTVTRADPAQPESSEVKVIWCTSSKLDRPVAGGKVVTVLVARASR